MYRYNEPAAGMAVVGVVFGSLLLGDDLWQKYFPIVAGRPSGTAAAGTDRQIWLAGPRAPGPGPCRTGPGMGLAPTPAPAAPDRTDMAGRAPTPAPAAPDQTDRQQCGPGAPVGLDPAPVGPNCRVVWSSELVPVNTAQCSLPTLVHTMEFSTIL